MSSMKDDARDAAPGGRDERVLAQPTPPYSPEDTATASRDTKKILFASPLQGAGGEGGGEGWDGVGGGGWGGGEDDEIIDDGFAPKLAVLDAQVND